MVNMGTYRDKAERRELYNDAVSVAVNSKQLDQAAVALDEGIAAADEVLDHLKKEKSLKLELLEILRRGKQFGLTEQERLKASELQQQLKSLKAPQQSNLTVVESPSVPKSYEQMIGEDLECAKSYGIDLSNPYLEAFSGIDKSALSKELSEDFDLLYLDKYDYAFSVVAGLTGGIIDILLVGTVSNQKAERGKLLEITDEAYNGIVKKYAKLNGWSGPRVNKDGTTSDPTKSAIGFLERNFSVNYDQRYRSDIKKQAEKIGQTLSDKEINDLNPSNHHLLNLSHSFSPLGLLTGTLDLLQGKSTFYDSGQGKIVRYAAEKSKLEIDGIFDAVTRWFDHCMSDIAGSSGAEGRGGGLPAPFMEIFQQLQFGKVPLGVKKASVEGVRCNQAVYGTIGDAVEELYKNGLDLRAVTAMSIPVIITELMVRFYWFIKQHFFYGKSVKESMPFGKSRELQRLLLISSLTFSSIDVTHAIIKGAQSGSPIKMLLTLNYVGLVNFGYKLYMNFRLEHEHNKQIREHMQTDVRDKFIQLLETDHYITGYE